MPLANANKTKLRSGNRLDGQQYTEFTDEDLEQFLYGAGSTMGITAGTTQTQAGATALTKRYNQVGTVGTAGDGVVLAPAAVGRIQTVKNNGANALAVYPASGDQIEGLSADASISLNPGDEVTFTASTDVIWRTNVSKEPYTASFSIAAEAANAIAVTIQLKDKVGSNIPFSRGFDAWISDASTGNAICATAPNGGIATSGTAVYSIVVTAGKILQIRSGATGSAVLTLTDSGTPTFYVAVRLPNGVVVVSSAVTFA